MKRVLTIITITVVLLIVILEASVRWLDNKPWVSYLDNRWAIKVVARVYEIDPFSSKEDDIRRTIKIAHFIALSKINKKPLDVFLIDLYEAQSLIERFIQKESSRLETEAIAELTLERLSLLNRINAVLLQSNRPVPINIESVKRDAKGLLLDVMDGDTKRALEKEIYLYDPDWHKTHLNRENIRIDPKSAIDAYHYGLASCAMHDEDGAELIALALANIPKNRLIEVIIRNVDFPLIAAAGATSNSACETAVDNIEKKLRR